MHITYGAQEIAHLTQKDPRLGAAIESIGPIIRKKDKNLVESVVRHIVGQQISIAAQATIWQRLCLCLGQVCVETLCACDRDTLQQCGLSFRKVEYIKTFAEKVQTGQLDLEGLTVLPDDEVITILSGLPGIGVWTAEMILLFGMHRPNIVSFGDLAIVRGMRMLYRHRAIDAKKFASYARKYSPYGTVASLYLWAIAGGALPDVQDPAKKKVKAVQKK